MRWVDPTVQLTACGSSNHAMATYGHWEHDVLDRCFEHVDFISLHQYFRNDANDLDRYFGVIEDLDAFIKEVIAIADTIAAKRHSNKRIMLALDEWNVWYKAHTPGDLRKPGWPRAPKLIEEIYNFEDALIVGGVLITLMNNADRVKCACLAQLVNVIGAIMCEPGGPAWRQTIFHPFAQASKWGVGTVLRTQVESGSFASGDGARLSNLLSSVLFDEASGRVAVFALNRSRAETELTVEMPGFGKRRLLAATELHHADIKAENTRARPDEVRPHSRTDVSLRDDRLQAMLKPLSFNVFVSEPG
jgi:alpha-N-arabinofuranosidase